MKQFDLVGKGIKLVLKENVLAVISDSELNTVSSAIYNGGGLKKTKIIINTQVTDEYGDRPLHDNPQLFITESFKKLGRNDNFVGMVTYANIADFALVSKTSDDLGVSVIATAGCTHAETAGEKIVVQPIAGTINIIVVIDGHPDEACLVSCLITATEAKTAALRELDVRSRYSGSEATGTVTDAMVVAETGNGPKIIYGGPASKLGQLVASCTRQAVKEAVSRSRIGGFAPQRSVVQRLAEHHLSVKRLAFELSKVPSLNTDAKTLSDFLTRKLNEEPLFASLVFAAVKISEDFEQGLVPAKFGDLSLLGKHFADLFAKKHSRRSCNEDCDVNLPPFLRQVLVGLLESALSEGKN
ncbi:MAG: adenosylcobinamide amidohydrolase [Candidatus Bathyarchaeota archaeon]|nr:adenosylcobinamide amidohydrolase [Candidatus Bathyarchaeota archaeon]